MEDVISEPKFHTTSNGSIIEMDAILKKFADVGLFPDVLKCAPDVYEAICQTIVDHHTHMAVLYPLPNPSKEPQEALARLINGYRVKGKMMYMNYCCIGDSYMEFVRDESFLPGTILCMPKEGCTGAFQLWGEEKLYSWVPMLEVKEKDPKNDEYMVKRYQSYINHLKELLQRVEIEVIGNRKDGHMVIKPIGGMGEINGLSKLLARVKGERE